MTISNSKSEAIVPIGKRWVTLCRLVEDELKYLGVLFTSDRKMEREIDRQIGATSAVLHSLY